MTQIALALAHLAAASPGLMLVPLMTVILMVVVVVFWPSDGPSKRLERLIKVTKRGPKKKSGS